MKHIILISTFVSALISATFTECSDTAPKKYKIGLCVMATGKYTYFLENLFKSADKYFCPQHDVTYFVFTDGQVPNNEHVIKIEQQRLGWPYDTMMRFAVYNKNYEQLAAMDYLFGCDADMLFKGTIGDEILGDRVATRHPGFLHQRGTYDTNPASTACVYNHEGEHYYAGGFFGGTAQEVLKMARKCAENIWTDLAKNYIALWHDESHLNRYFIDHKPTVILSELYCFPDNWEHQNPKLWAEKSPHIKLVCLEKSTTGISHEQWRS